MKVEGGWGKKKIRRQENGGNSRSTARIKGKYARFGTLLCGSGMRARNLCEWGGGSADGSALSPADSRELGSDFR